MKHKIQKITSMIIVAVVILTCFSSCKEAGEEHKETTEAVGVTEVATTENEAVGTLTTCFLLGNTANMPKMDMDILKDEIKSIAGTGEKYCLIVLDGEPELNIKEEVKFPKRFVNQKKNNEKVIQEHVEKIYNTNISRNQSSIA